MLLPDGEPEFGPWRAVSAADLLDGLGRPRILAVGGRSGSGKSTLAALIAAAVPGSAVVHTDDVDWAELMASGVLEPLRGGAARVGCPRAGRGSAVRRRPQPADRRPMITGTSGTLVR